MPIVPIGVGDRVRLLRVREDYYERHPNDPYRLGVVTDVENLDYPQLHVRWESDNNHSGWFDAAEVEALCHHCGMVHEEHTENEKCLYEPTHWKGPSP